MTIFINYSDKQSNVEIHNGGRGMGMIRFEKKSNTTPLELAEEYAQTLKRVLGGDNIWIKKGKID
jgi:hypothetical protein